MARWDEILTLPVQNPPTPEFSAADIMWSRVEGWRETMDRLALIPFTRVGDFVRGEGNNKDCPTRFHVEARRRRPPEMAYKPKVDGILEYILYWCSFGPDDHRKGGTVRPSRTYNAKRKTPAGRPNTKRGCVCHFIVKRLIAEPSVALIIYNQDKHVDKKGLPCHGPQDQKAVGTRAMFAPDISDEFRLQIISLLYVGVPVETIMQRHTEMVEKQGGPCNRDDLLTHRYVRRLERKIRRSTYELDDDDYVSLGMWIRIHQDHIFYFEEYSDSEPFVLGIQTEWQLQQMIQFGNRRLLAADSRFGANKLKYPIYSLLVFDSNNNAIPVAWIVTPNFASGEIYRWLGSLYDRVRSKDPTWILGGFIVDDPSADVHSIREVFKCSVLISFWRVRRSWHKNLIMKCSETEMRAQMLKRLGEAFSSICRGSGDVGVFEDFMEDFVDCQDFLDYFKGVWFPRIGQWVAALKALPLASTEVSAAFESYHHQLNLRLLNENDSTIYLRADWLVDKLGTKVHSYYWLDEYSEKESFARYWRDEWKSGLTSWREALQIPDLDVVLDVKSAKVVSRKVREKVHIVINPGSEFSLCDCGWSMLGNLCKHVIKSTRICRERGLVTPSISLFDYNRTLRSTLCRPPYDSVIRDHAISLTVSVQTILNSLFDLQNGIVDTTASVYAEQQTVVDLENTDNDLMYKNHLASEKGDENLRNENCSVSFDHSVADATPRPVGEPSTLLSPIEQELSSNNTIVNDTAEAETGNSLKEIRNLGSNSSNASKIRDGSWDDMVVDSCADQVNDTLNVFSTEKINDIDPPLLHPLPSTSSSRSEADVVEERSHDTQISDVVTNKDKEVRENLEAHPDGSMIIEVGVSNGVCHDAEEGSFLNQNSRLEIVENTDILQNSETVEKVGGEVVEATDRNEVLDAKLTISKMDLKPCSLVTKAHLLGSLDDYPINVVMNQDSDESTGNVRMSSDVGDITESADTMDIDMPAAVGEVDEKVSLC